jgi:hypothetical protein
MSKAVMMTIEAYHPRFRSDHWNVVVAFTRQAVIDLRPPTQRQAQLIMSMVSQLAKWAWQDEGLDLTYTTVFEPSVIRAFVDSRAKKSSAAARRNISSRLLVFSRELTESTEVFTGIGADRSLEPQRYFPGDRAWQHSWARGHRSVEKRRSAHQLLGLCGGAGLRPTELFVARPEDVNERDDGLVVTVRGPQARTVPVHPGWESALRIGIAGTDPGVRLFRPQLKSAKSGLTSLMQPFSKRHPTSYALRATWLLAMLENFTTKEVMQLGGFNSGEGLNRYLQLIPSHAEADLFARARMLWADA